MTCAMYICICKKVSDHQIRRAVSAGEVSCFSDLRQRCGVGSQCGKCARDARQLVREALRDTAPAMPEVCQAA